MFDTFRVPICVQYVQIYMCNKSFQEKFVKGVHKLVAQYLSDGRQKVLQNYMIWRVVASFYPDQPSEEYHRYGALNGLIMISFCQEMACLAVYSGF